VPFQKNADVDDPICAARDAKLPLPRALAVFSPWLDFTEEGESYRRITDDPIVLRPMLDLFKQAYLKNGDHISSDVTPFYADFRGLPPTLVHVGSWERLHDDSTTLAARLKAAGVSTELTIFDGMCHGTQLFAPMLDEGMESIEQAARFLRNHEVSK
jgi:epsilon-lactone hydrolase